MWNFNNFWLKTNWWAGQSKKCSAVSNCFLCTALLGSANLSLIKPDILNVNLVFQKTEAYFPGKSDALALFWEDQKKLSQTH